MSRHYNTVRTGAVKTPALWSERRDVYCKTICHEKQKRNEHFCAFRNGRVSHPPKEQKYVIPTRRIANEIVKFSIDLIIVVP